MGNLLASLTTAAESLRSFERALSVTSNNVANAKTPGYVKQQVNFVAQRLELNSGLPGGVKAEGLRSARDSYLEQAVRKQSQQAAGAGQRSTLLEQVEPILDIASGAGIAGAFDAFHAAVSQWTIGPNDVPARQNVLRAAAGVAQAFRSTAQSLEASGQGGDREIDGAVAGMNRLGEVLLGLNRQIRADARAQDDPGIDAQVHAALEELSQFADFTVLRAEDGSYSVFLGHQTPFVIGDHQYAISADFSGNLPAIRDAEGRDITRQFLSGKIEAVAEFRNTFLPGVMADLNRLAGTFADQVNLTLAGGLDRSGQPPAQQLFSYNVSGGIAQTLSVSPLAPEGLAGASTAAPGGNGNALALADMLGRRNIDNYTFPQFFGELAGRVGSTITVAKDEEKAQGRLLAQMKAIREEQTQISLDEEAANLIQFQRSYEATAKMIQTLDELTQTLINLKR